MAVIWFILALLFFILWVNKKPQETDQSQDYRQGYWDGYRSFGDQVKQELDKGTVSSKQLERFISDGYPPEYQDEEAQVEDEPVVQINEVSRHFTQPKTVAVLAPYQREAQTVRNLNTMLYVASFLLVAAAAAFVAASMPPFIRLMGL